MPFQLSTAAGDVCLYLGSLLDDAAGRQATVQMPALQRLVARATVRKVPVCDAVSFANWVSAIPDSAPVAAVCRYFETGRTDEHCWLMADPVWLQPAQDTLALRPATPDDANNAASSFRKIADYLRQDGWYLEASAAGHWYLRAPAPLQCKTIPTARVSRADIFACMPAGRDGPRLRSLMNDVQMLLHDDDAGTSSSFNSIWPWGQGSLNDLPCAPGVPVAAVFARHPYLRGLWQRWQVPSALPSDAAAALATGDGFVAMPEWTVTDVGLEALDRRWLAPLLGALAVGQLKTLAVILNNGHCAHLSRGDLRRFWRRPKSLGKTLARLAGPVMS